MQLTLLGDDMEVLMSYDSRKTEQIFHNSIDSIEIKFKDGTVFKSIPEDEQKIKGMKLNGI